MSSLDHSLPRGSSVDLLRLLELVKFAMVMKVSKSQCPTKDLQMVSDFSILKWCKSDTLSIEVISGTLNYNLSLGYPYMVLSSLTLWQQQ